MSNQVLEIKDIVIKKFDTINAIQVIWDKFHQLNESLTLEVQPRDSLLDREIIESDLKFNNSDFQIYRWLVFRDKFEKELIGWYVLKVPKESSVFAKAKKRIGYIDILIQKEYRRQGLGRLLLKKLVEKSNTIGCEMVQTRTSFESGIRFCEKLEGKLINIESENRLYFKDVDWNLITKWIEEGRKRNPNTTIKEYYGVAVEKIEEYCELLAELEMDKPTLEDEDEKQSSENYTPEGYREFVQYMNKKTFTVYTLRSNEKDGRISGITEIFFSKEKSPKRIEQGMTGVKSIYRGRGIGKWLKALMLDYIKNNLPEAEYWVTGNADHNEPMLSINERLGFKHIYTKKTYQFDLIALQNNLKEKKENEQ